MIVIAGFTCFIIGMLAGVGIEALCVISKREREEEN